MPSNFSSSFLFVLHRMIIASTATLLAAVSLPAAEKECDASYSSQLGMELVTSF
jgi:hypothetical protein